MLNFIYQNIGFTTKGRSAWVFIKGEITNKTKNDYQTAAFRLNIFKQENLFWSGIFKIKNFKRNQTKSFEHLMDDFKPKNIRKITRHEISFEAGY